MHFSLLPFILVLLIHPVHSFRWVAASATLASLQGLWLTGWTWWKYGEGLVSEVDNAKGMYSKVPFIYDNPHHYIIPTNAEKYTVAPKLGDANFFLHNATDCPPGSRKLNTRGLAIATDIPRRLVSAHLGRRIAKRVIERSKAPDYKQPDICYAVPFWAASHVVADYTAYKNVTLAGEPTNKKFFKLKQNPTSSCMEYCFERPAFVWGLAMLRKRLKWACICYDSGRIMPDATATAGLFAWIKNPKNKDDSD